MSRLLQKFVLWSAADTTSVALQDLNFKQMREITLRWMVYLEVPWSTNLVQTHPLEGSVVEGGQPPIRVSLSALDLYETRSGYLTPHHHRR